MTADVKLERWVIWDKTEDAPMTLVPQGACSGDPEFERHYYTGPDAMNALNQFKELGFVLDDEHEYEVRKVWVKLV